MRPGWNTWSFWQFAPNIFGFTTKQTNARTPFLSRGARSRWQPFLNFFFDGPEAAGTNRTRSVLINLKAGNLMSLKNREPSDAFCRRVIVHWTSTTRPTSFHIHRIRPNFSRKFLNKRNSDFCLLMYWYQRIFRWMVISQNPCKSASTVARQFKYSRNLVISTVFVSNFDWCASASTTFSLLCRRLSERVYVSSTRALRVPGSTLYLTFRP